MPDQLEQLDRALISHLRRMAREGRTPSEMFGELKRSLGTQIHIVTLLDYFRQAFCLTVADVKPIAGLSRNEERDVEDEALLDQLLSPVILNHRTEWDNPQDNGSSSHRLLHFPRDLLSSCSWDFRR